MSSKNSKSQTIEEIYKKKDVHEHVLSEPDMWMGSIHLDKKELWVYDGDEMVKKEIEYIPGLYKIYDEILVNARDHSIRDKTCKNIRVSINKDTGMIKVWNDGYGIPTEVHKEYNVYVPELIFANLLTSANYDKKGKITGGKNGLGAKLANIYSTEFHIETVDSKNKKFYHQKCENNMYKINKPEIKTCSQTSYTEISFIPDFKKFKLNGLTSDIISLFKKRVYDIAGCTNKNVKVFLDDKELKVKSFEDYISLFVDRKKLVYEEVNDRWRVGVIFDPSSGFQHISFVNGISTFQGGTHVAYVTEQICKKIIDHINNKYKKVTVKPSHVRDNMTIFIDCVIEDPSFNSQTKDFLGSKVSEYGSICDISSNFIKKLIETGLVDEVVRLAQFKAESELKKTDGKKVASLNDIPKYERALWAGTRKSKYCRLILTEGDSAKTFAISGLEIIGREKYGVFPLKGKPLNAREATISQLKNNAEFANIKRILGLKQGKKYTDVSKLRYGGIIILTDQDSVTGDTPLLLRHNNIIEIKTIDSLTQTWIKNINGKEYGNANYEIWTDSGWTKIKSVMRHKVNKQIFRVVSEAGIVDVTEDHSLLDINKREIRPIDCNLNTELLYNFPKFYTPNDDNITRKYNEIQCRKMIDSNRYFKTGEHYDPETKLWRFASVNKIPNYNLVLDINCDITNDEAYVMGMFFINGNFDSNNNLNITNKKLNSLRESKNILKKIYKKLQFEIKENENNSNIHKLIVSKSEIITNKYTQLFYDKDGNKKIPSEILNTNKSIRNKFFDGCCDATIENGCFEFNINGKIGAHSFYFLCKSLGYLPLIHHNIDEPNIYIIKIKSTSSSISPKIKEIIPLNIKDVYVYDLETENHHFQAGVGSLIVHNTDGSHIKGLIINMLHRFWPSLLKINGFIQSMATPIIKVFKKSDTKKLNPIIFYTITDYKNWISEIGDKINQYDKPKYYKGLGTSTEKEAKQCFLDFENKIINYIWECASNNQNNDDKLDDINDDDSAKDNSDTDNDSEDDIDINDINSKSYEAITLAFEKVKAADRKTWLLNYNKNDIIHDHCGNIPISDFINKDLIHFSNYDNIRSIPSMCDGFKPSLRKILYASLKRRIENTEIKVAQLGAYVAETSDYHHGEMSLQQAIVNMAQNFVGSNNINFLLPIGNFGSRRKGGDDASSARYIFTKLNPLVSYLFRKEDQAILNKQYVDDNENDDEIEPQYYCPIMPTVLINGSCGIGTGFSTSIPCFNPLDIANNIINMIEGKNPNVIHPWYRGFKGKIIKVVSDKTKEIKYQTSGIYQIINENVLRITELPIGEWTEYYCDKISKDLLIDDKKKEPSGKKILTDIQNNSGNNSINIELTFYGTTLQKLIKNSLIEKELKLTTTLSVTNMYLYNTESQICKYDYVEDIFIDFYTFRLNAYKKRKEHMIKHLENIMMLLNYKVKFIQDFISKKIILNNKKGSEVLKKLEELKYPKMNNDAYASDDQKTYNYLTGMQIWSLTEEKIEELNNELNKSKIQYEEYLKTPVEEIWKNEILEFLDKYNKWIIDSNEEDNNNSNKKKGKNIKIKVKGKQKN